MAFDGTMVLQFHKDERRRRGGGGKELIFLVFLDIFLYFWTRANWRESLQAITNTPAKER